MRKFFHDHSLGLIAIFFYAMFQVGAWFLPDGRLQEMFAGHADDTWGAIFVIFFTKWFYEKFSAESK